MPATSYKQYFNIDEKYYAVVTKELIDQGRVRWDAFYPHETFIQLLRQVVDMLSGKESRGIWFEGIFGTGKSHAALTVKSLLEAPEAEVRRYFDDFKLSEDLCNHFLAARSEEMNGPLIVIHRIGSSNIKNDDDLVWAVQSSISRALAERGIENHAEGTLKDALIKWLNEKAANKQYLNALLSDDAFEFNGMNADQLIDALNSGNADSIQYLMTKLIRLGRDNNMSFLKMDAPMLADWIRKVIAENHLGSIVFIWDEFSEFFRNCQNSLTGFQTLAQISEDSPFYFVLVTHESEALITNTADRIKIKNRFIEPSIRIELPDNMAFRLMAQAMKETDDPVMRDEWHKAKQALNVRLSSVRNAITTSVKRSGQKGALSDADLQEIIPLHPYAALILKHISRVFTASQRSMFDFIIARDPEEDEVLRKAEDGTLKTRAFKWFINHHSAFGPDNLMTVDMLWDFFNTKAGGNMNPDALEILNNFETLSSEYHLNKDEQRVLRTVLLMNAICTRVKDASMLVPTYENIDLSFLGTSWPQGKASNIAKSLVHREPPLQPVLFEEPTGEGDTMRVIPKAGGGVDIMDTKKRVREQISAQSIAQEADLLQKLKVPDNLAGHFNTALMFTNLNSSQTFNNAVREAKTRAQNAPGTFQLCIIVAMTDDERADIGKQIQNQMRGELPENLLLLDASTSTFSPYLDNYLTNKAYSEYYLKSDKRQSGQFSAYAAKNIATWVDVLRSGEFRLYDAKHPNGQMRMGYEALCELLNEIDHSMYPLGIEQYNVNPTMFSRISMGLGAECGITQVEKGAFTSSNVKTKLSTALSGAWKVEGNYWEDPSKQGLVIVQIKKRVEELIAKGFDKNGRIDIIDIYQELQKVPFGFTASNLAAFMLGFVLKEYANEQYFWSNGTTRPMSVELMKGAIKNALDQSVTPKPNYRPEAIVLMSDKLRRFLSATASLFHEQPEHCGSVDAAASVIRVGMKKMEFPIWCLKSLLPTAQVKTDTAIIADVIDRYLGIANIRNLAQKTTESDLATEIGELLMAQPSLQEDLEALLTSQNCRAGMRAYLDDYRSGELPVLAATIKDGGAYINEVKKKFNADEANWVWSEETARVKIDEVIVEYSIVAESNSIIAPAASLTACVRNWKDRLRNFRLSYEAMETECGDLKELLGLLCSIKRSPENAIPEMKKARFLELLQKQKNDFVSLYRHQQEMFKKIAAGWLTELSDEDIDELFSNYLDTDVYTDSAEKYFKAVEVQMERFLKEKTKARLEQIWREKTGTSNPREWSSMYGTPILCMFDDVERARAAKAFDAFRKSNLGSDEAESVMSYLQKGDFYDRLASQESRDECMRLRVVEDYAYLLPDMDDTRNYLRNHFSMIHPYDWMDNRSIRNGIKMRAENKYKTGGASMAQRAIDDLGLDDVRAYLKDLIKENMDVGVAILKKQKH